MTIDIEYEAGKKLDIDYETIINRVCEAALEHEDCPYDACINVVITDAQSIQEVNRETRGIDAPTDVLSFPMNEMTPGDYSNLEDDPDAFEPDTGELLLGDIMLCVDKIFEQAAAYGHSLTRELAFLTAHSMLHLLGYDHVDDEERKQMEERQEEILKLCGFTRDNDRELTGDKV